MSRADWFDQWVTCPTCGETHGANTGCDHCAYLAARAGGHYGYYDLLNGWTCYASCPACQEEDEFI